ncbi:MAG: 1-deoxy-D-xylulose-5-phosphate synthase [Candidatus Nitronauta litoralis]|uniref:1-deoxy-D-xylulose-5-phosphate synthase n=1 Tax=Candidatus Nitronauta litoralis TaxID=2705533 RepID=A0A7T0BT42_9BACT|nr:MAG: 1-deoxy-D-xylulose-5-phosphate synthase [Candidatus Nitronauta litoralis]
MTQYLDKIESPADIKKFGEKELKVLAGEIRDRLLSTISKTGGHLGSNMGVVELTLAMHYVFNTPADKFVWDVGHQSYVHKLLTGRNKRFDTLRQYQGLSGFTKREECQHDCWNTGHGGTSISAALGFAKANEIKKQDNKVVAVIGDGSLTSGMAFEALNHAGHIKSNMIVVLNDNEMSIAPNVGGLSAHLSQIMTGQWMTRIKKEVDEVLLAIPGIGEEISKYAHKLDETIKGIFIPGRLFEDLGLRYIGPIDGHDTQGLIETFENIKDLEGPTVMHVITRKGKGYKVAEEKADIWHGAKPFNIETGEFHKKKANPAYTAIFAEALIELAREDEDIVAITAAMPDGTGISKFGKVFPERTFDVGMAEQHAVDFASALALEGLRPVTAIYSTFLQRAYDQVVHDVCLMDIPMTFAMDRAGIVGEDGATHQGLYDIAYLRTLPNMIIMGPKDENELRDMLKTSIYHEGPAAIRFPRDACEGLDLNPEMKIMEIGKGEVLQDGTDIAVVAFGHVVPRCREVVKNLEAEGHSVAFINARFAKPIDEKLMIEYALKTKCMVTVEEHSRPGGFGSAVLESLHDHIVDQPLNVKTFGVADIVVEHGAPKIIRKDLGLDEETLTVAIRSFYQNVVNPEATTATQDSNGQGNGNGISVDAKSESGTAPVKKPTNIGI